MDITFNCDQCGQQLVIDEAAVGVTVECPKCGQELTVPSRDWSAPSEAPTPAPTTNRQILGLRVAGTLFGLACLAQLLCLVTGVEVVVGGHQVLHLVGMVAAVVTGGMSLWMWKLSSGLAWNARNNPSP